MANLPLALGLVAGEITVLLGVTVRAFGAEARLRRDRGDAVKRAKAGRETMLLERIGQLVEDVRSIKLFLEKYTDALFRADWTDDVKEIGVLGVGLFAVDRAQARLILRWRLLALTMVVVHVAAPGFLMNNILGQELVPEAVDVGCAWLFGVSSGAAFACGWFVRQADLAFERCLEEGVQ